MYQNHLTNISSEYVRFLLCAVMDAKLPITKKSNNTYKYNKTDIYNRCRQIVEKAYDNNCNSYSVSRHTKDTFPFITIHDRNIKHSYNALAVDYVKRQKGCEDTIIKQLRKLLCLMSTSSLSRAKKEKPFKYGALILTNATIDDLITSLLSRYFELVGIYTMLKNKATNLYCVCCSKGGTIKHIKLNDLYQKVCTSHSKPVLDEVREIAKRHGTTFTENEIQEMLGYVLIAQNGYSNIVTNPSNNITDLSRKKLMEEALKALFKLYGITQRFQR